MENVLIQAQNSLAPYIKSRKEALHIRQVLAAHLASQLSHATEHSQGPVISLVHESVTVKSSSGHLSALRKEYLKALRANTKARREYDRLCNTNNLRNGDLTSRDVLSGSFSSAENLSNRNEQLNNYLALIKLRQRHERLRILQDYINKLEHKSAAATSFLDQSEPQLSGIPQLPVDIVASSAWSTGPNHKALKDLIRSLEQAVLRAKVQLRNERQLLEQIKADSLKGRQAGLSPVPRDVQNLQALSLTRNELIAWVEEELGKAGGSELENASETYHPSATSTTESIEDQLVIVKARYGRYVQARRKFIDTIAETIEPISASNPSEKREADVEDNENENSPSMAWILSPYLQDLQLISNEQKSLIQLKSHLTVSLAKQHKETVQLFDRLAHESHLLPAHPMKSTGQVLDNFDLDGMAGKEMPSAAHRARAWTYAGESARAAMKDFVLANTEEGEVAIESARGTLSTLDQLLGRKGDQAEPTGGEDIWTSETTTSSRAKAKTQADIWAMLDGNLGVLQREGDMRLS